MLFGLGFDSRHFHHMARRTKKATEAIKVAYDLGYRVVDGEVISPLGNKRPLRIDGNEGPTFSMKIRGRSTPVSVLGLSARQKKRTRKAD